MNRKVVIVLAMALVLIGAGIIWAGAYYYDTAAGIVEGGAAIHQLDSNYHYIASKTISGYARTAIIIVGIVVALCGPMLLGIWDWKHNSRKEEEEDVTE